MLQTVSKQDFVLPKLGPKLVGFREEVRTGRGFQLIRLALLPLAAKFTQTTSALPLLWSF